ncbi:MAG TPA: sialidase family protein [Candidatus Dormibacteraeota bacterium]|nr:sialidase family protein [Candidatus Dormibacteraeota bacterium]
MPRFMVLDNWFVSRCATALTLLTLLFAVGTANAQMPLTQISTDTFTNTTSQHQTEVEPASYALGSTIVSVFQIGRFTDGGSSDIGFSTSTNGGTTWTHGNLPGITKLEGTGSYDRASDPSVTYNAKFKLWLAETLALSDAGGAHGAAVLVSSSTDGITWNNPATVSIVEQNGFYDKPWIGCDNTSTSPHYGNCYVEWDDFSQFDLIEMSTSTDGGKTWSAKKTTTGSGSGNGGLPLVQPNGTVIVPIDDPFLASVLAFKSTDGGATWTAPVTVAFISEHGVGGGMRALPLIAAQMDAAGTVYVVWADCRFRTNCSSNDLVMSTSTNGTTWSAVTRIPIDPTSSTLDHFTPGLAIKSGTSGSTARIGVAFNYFPVASCTTSCKLGVAYIASANGGSTWGAPKPIAGGMNPAWLPSTTSGQMVGDFMTASFVGQKVYSVFADATAPVGATLNEEMFTNARGLSDDAADDPQFSSANDKPVPNAHSDRPRRTKPHRDDER